MHESLHGRLRWADAVFGYRVGGPREDLAIDRRDNARFIPKCRVIEPAFTWGEEHRPQIPWEETIILELHVPRAHDQASRLSIRRIAAHSPASPRRR